jgi:hypothetical protein
MTLSFAFVNWRGSPYSKAKTYQPAAPGRPHLAASQRYFILRFLVGGAVRAVRHALKNCVEILSDACFDEQGLFWRRYILHVSGLRRIRKVTCTGLPGEGPGSQALMTMNASIL